MRKVVVGHRVCGPGGVIIISYSFGLLLTVLLNASLWGGVALTVGSRPARRPLFDRLLATSVVGFVLIVVGMEVLSAFGGVGRAGLLGISGFAIVVGIAAWGQSRQQRRGVIERETECGGVPDGSGAQGLFRGGTANGNVSSLCRFSAASVLFFAVWAALYYLLRGLVFPVETVSDAPIYHLPFATGWWKAGWFEPVAAPFGELAATYFPANGDVWLCWLVTGSGSEMPAKVGQWPFLLLGATAIFGLARLIGAGGMAAVFPAAVWMALPAVLAFSPVANVDLIFTAFYLIAVYFLVTYWRDRRQDSLVLLALACGLAIGTKAVGLVFAVPIVLTALVAVIGSGNPVRHAVLLIGGLALPCFYWFARNVYWTGNPLYPLHLEWFGRTLLSGCYDRAAMLHSAYHVPTTQWRAFVDRFAAVVDLRLAWLWPMSLLMGIGLAFQWSREGRTAAGLSLLAVVQGLVYWFVIPYNTQERFLLPALGLGLVPLACLLKDRWWLQVPLVMLLAWHLLWPQWQTQWTLEEPVGKTVLLPWNGGRLSQGAMGFGLALPVSLLVAWIIFANAGRLRWILSAAVVAAGCLIVAWPSISMLRQRPLLRFYPTTHFAPNLLPAWLALEAAAGPEGSRVAYAGTNLPYYLFGRGLRNEVFYVNVNGQPEALLHDYHEARLRHGDTILSSNPWPDWYRANPDYEAWLENLRRAGIEYLFVARENRHGKRDVPPGLPPFPIERRWARGHPEVFEPVPLPFPSPTGDPWAEVFRVKEAAP